MLQKYYKNGVPQNPANPHKSKEKHPVGELPGISRGVYVKKFLKGKFFYKANYNINWKKKQYHFDEYSFCNWLQYTK